MKTFKEIMQDIKSARMQLEESKATEKALTDKWLSEYDREKRKETYKDYTQDLIKAEKATKNLSLTIKFLQNNARISLFHDVMPVLLDILSKYEGKPYGEKTREKIAKELEERIGARAYISTRYDTDEIRIYPSNSFGNTYTITVGTKPNEHILIDNKIQILPIESFSIWYINKRYFEDIQAAIVEMETLYNKAYSMQKELDSVCGAFNKYAVEGISSIYCDKRIYERMII